ncbi:hypothetical protein MKX36_17285 [Paenibacillus sp. FSL W8-0439]|uniref:DUF6933 domain-containing protein n=1 Tax=Paenibacillus sp. FSL W8-0439 TaxID=2921716 RepID=UPI0030FB1EB5
MYVIRATQKLLKEMDCKVQKTDISVPLNTWHANMFTLNRRKTIVFMNDLSRLSLTIVGFKKAQLKSVEELFVNELRNYLMSEEIEEKVISRYIEENEGMIITTTNNRSVIGTLNEIIYTMKIIEREFVEGIERNQWNNRFIYKAIKYEYPIEVFKKAMEENYRG